MEKAQGFSGHVYAKKATGGNGADTISTRNLPKEVTAAEERNKLNGRLARKLNRLQWLEIITSQGDRHKNNHFIRIDPVTRDVDLKGIDNNACFPATRIGVQKYKLPKARAKVFGAALLQVCHTLCGQGHYRTEAAR